MPIEARNSFVFIIRDEAETEAGGLLIPGQSQEKPHYGEVISVGDTVADKKIKNDKRVMYFKGNGFNILYEGKEYLVIEGERIIAAI